MLEKQDLDRIRDWMSRNARPLELARWRHAFEGADRAEVLRVLEAYRNPDGGFGHALEADNWDPSTSPLQTWTACTILDEIGAEGGEPAVRETLRYLAETSDYKDGMWRSAVPTANDHPHAPWWGWKSDAATRAEWGYNPSAALAGYALLWDGAGGPAYVRAAEAARGAVADALSRGVDANRHLTVCHRTLVRGIESLPTDVRDREFPGWDRFRDLVLRNVSAAIDRDPCRWFISYATLPTDLITSPDDPQYPMERECVAAALDGMLDTRSDEGVWDISWTWDGYPEAFAVSRRWWQGVMALERVRLLHAFGRVAGMKR